MFRKKLLGFAAVGALSLGGCGLGELVDTLQQAAQQAASQVQVGVTKQNVKGSINAVAAAFRGLDALKNINIGGGAASGLLAQAAETGDCLGGGSVTVDEAEDGSSFSIAAENCVFPDGDLTVTVNGKLRFETGDSQQSGNATFSYEADLEWTVEDASGNTVEQFRFSDFTMSGEMAMDQMTSTLSEDYTFNGSQTFVDETGKNTLSFSNFRLQMVSTENQSSAKLSIDGGFTFDLADANCADGAFTFDTTTPLVVSDAADCPNAGVITVNGVTYSFEGETITATSGDASESLNCDELTSDDQCSLDEDNDDFSGDNTSETM